MGLQCDSGLVTHESPGAGLVYGATCRRVNNTWQDAPEAPPFGPFWMTSPNSIGHWETWPDDSWETSEKCWHDPDPEDEEDEHLWYETGEYMLWAVFENPSTMETAQDQTFWTIP